MVDAAGWSAIDDAEIARGGERRPRDKFTTVADMLAAAAAAPAPSMRDRVLAGPCVASRYWLCFIASSISSMLTSRIGWPIDHRWPNGSRTTPYRSPQNASSSG